MKKRDKYFWMALVILTGLTFAVALEGVLRLSGYYPWKTFVKHPNEPNTFEPHPVLGWVALPGKYEYPPYTPDGEPIRLTFLPEGGRATGPGRKNKKPKIVLVGGSITEGWAISDHQTFAWKIQQRFSQFTVLNLGTSGYGTYQSLLTLEDFFRRNPDSNALVIYGFVSFHDERNVGSFAWRRLLAIRSQRQSSNVPYCRLSSSPGRLRKHPPEAYPRLPFRNKLALSGFLSDFYVGLRSLGAMSQKKEVTCLLLKEMKQLCARNKAKLIVAILHSENEDLVYQEFMADNNILYVNCTSGLYLRPDYRVPEEGHPNHKMNQIWADCIGKAIANMTQPGSKTKESD